MLTVCIHLYNIAVSFTHRIFITKLQTTPITQIKYIGNHRMVSLFSHMICLILRRIIHDQYVCNLRYLRLFRWVCTAAAVFCFLFLLPYLVLDRTKFMTIPIVIQYLKGSYGQVDMGATMALILLSILPVIVFYLLCQKHIIKGVAAGAVKG